MAGGGDAARGHRDLDDDGRAGLARCWAAGFDVVISDAAGGTLAHARADELITPEVAPTPPLGGTLDRARDVSRRARRRLRVAARRLEPRHAARRRRRRVQPAPGRVAMKMQTLAAGLHDLEMTMRNTDGAGGIAFAVRPPSVPWRGPLARPGRRRRRAARRRAEAHRRAAAALLLRLFAVAAPLATLLAISRRLARHRRLARRARVRAYVAALAADPLAQPLSIVALAFVAIVLPMLGRCLRPASTRVDEEESYIVRLVEYELLASAAACRMGRWWPDPVLGRGYPFLCLYAPLLYFAGDALPARRRLVAGRRSRSSRAALVVVGAAATFIDGAARASRPAALLAATLFTYAPYLHTDLWMREDLAESLGFACFPLAMHRARSRLDAARRRSAAARRHRLPRLAARSRSAAATTSPPTSPSTSSCCGW